MATAKKAAPKKATADTATKAPKKAAPKKAATEAPKKAATKKAAAPKKAANSAFMAPLTLSDTLAAVIGSQPLPRTEIIKKIWDYIKEKGLQDEKNKRMINADAKLEPLFGKKQISMFELAKIVSQHVK